MDNKDFIKAEEPNQLRMPRNKKKKKGGIGPSNMPKKSTPEEQIDLRTKRPKVKGVRIAKRGGGRAYGKNS